MSIYRRTISDQSHTTARNTCLPLVYVFVGGNATSYRNAIQSDFKTWFIEIIGDEEYARLKAMTLTDIQKHTVYDLEGIKEYLQNELKKG